jgi:SAM-dependent methyltransferase
MIFKNYARYYNLINKDKDYSGESEYILKLIKENADSPKSILDIGCGTGMHASLFAQCGFSVAGIDLSSEMIEIANSSNFQNCNFQVGNATCFDLKQKYDIITSLFHVLSYQLSNNDVEKLLNNTKIHMNKEGVFIFDFWYTPAVFNLRPTVKIRRIEDNELKIVRLSEPMHHTESNIIDVNFEFIIEEKLTCKTESFIELHKMRYFSIPEIEYFLERCGFKSLLYEEWMTGNVPSEETWGVCCVAKLIN